MNFMEEYARELEAQALAERQAEEARWAALTPEARAKEVQELQEAFEAKVLREEQIAARHEAQYGPDDPEDLEDEED